MVMGRDLVRDVCVPTSASSRGVFFTNRTDIEHRKVSDISNRDPKANNFESRRAKYRNTINLSQEESIKVISHLL
jgi:hypothetical protein